MFFYLSHFAATLSFLNIFRYITLRSIGALITSFLIVFLFGGRFIAKIKHYQKQGQPIREDGPQSHLLTKKGTPTMGGILVLFSFIVSVLAWSDLQNKYLWPIMACTCCFAIIGFFDDFLKLLRKKSSGLSVKLRLILQFIISIATILYMQKFLMPESTSTVLLFPFAKKLYIDLGWFFAFFSMFIVTGTANAVNLTDGLDGLAIGPVMMVSAVFAIIAYVLGNAIFSSYLQLQFISGAGEIAVLCSAVIGAGLGFLWYNSPPASIFMGDTGSLSLGAFLGIISVITKHEIILAIVGGIFVLEAVSVILQVASYKLTRKRIFLMAPIHHHFEKKGWSESTVVMRFWIISMMLSFIGLASLKIR